ncbi:MAG: hypothetical protein ABI134_03330, partial [Byssovorax sp.]
PTAEILEDARVEVRRYCWFRNEEVTRLDQLSHKLRSLNGESSGRIHRAVLLRELLLSGLELAESKAQPLDVFTGHGVRFVYSLTLEDVARVKRLSESLWPRPKGRPSLENFRAALMRLALRAAETDESFARAFAARALRASESA